MSAADLFTRVAARCTFQPASGKWIAWIDAEMRKTEDIDGKVLAVRRKQEDELRRHQREMAKLDGELKSIQPYCDHDFQRGDAQCSPVCQRCGWTDGEDARRS